MKVPIEISARHIHLSSEDCIKLFGTEKITKLKLLGQPGQFAAKEVVRITGPKNNIDCVRVTGPHRKYAQLEISITDAYFLGIIPPPILISGNLKKSVGGLTIKGSKGEFKLPNGIIVAQRHLHISPEEAAKLGLKRSDNVKIKIGGERTLIFENVVVRSRKGDDKLSFHVDTDEANAAGIKNGDYGEIVT